MALNKTRGRDLPVGQIKEYVAHILKGRGVLSYSGHVKKRMREREFDTQDIVHLLDTGTFSKGFWEAQAQNHEFNVKGYDLNGEELELSCALVSPLAVTVVTGKRPKYESS